MNTSYDLSLAEQHVLVADIQYSLFCAQTWYKQAQQLAAAITDPKLKEIANKLLTGEKD